METTFRSFLKSANADLVHGHLTKMEDEGWQVVDRGDPAVLALSVLKYNATAYFSVEFCRG